MSREEKFCLGLRRRKGIQTQEKWHFFNQFFTHVTVSHNNYIILLQNLSAVKRVVEATSMSPRNVVTLTGVASIVFYMDMRT
jgi:hypothetical protein